MKNLIADMQTNKYVAGARQVHKLLLKNQIKKVYVATDCEQEFLDKLTADLKKFDVEVASCGTRQEFAKLCNIDVLCGVIGIASQN